MRDLIMETDLGRDPDDFFALCYLIGCGKVNMRLITISPGDPDQVAVAKFVLSELGLDVPVGVGKRNLQKSSASGVHTRILEQYKFPPRLENDGYGPELIEQTLEHYPNCEIFACGPLNSVGRYLKDHPDAHFERATMQGGFCGYGVHGREVVTLKKFLGKTTVATFNLNTDKGGARAFLEANIDDRRFVGKHLCHTIVYNCHRHEQVPVHPRNRAHALFIEAMSMYLEKHQEGKKFHDPLAAVAHVFPEIFTWVTGRLYKDRGEWGTELWPQKGPDQIAIDVDRDAFWERITTFQ
jgi:inosine-uridine nucleoside N-ribohydrolase